MTEPKDQPFPVLRIAMHIGPLLQISVMHFVPVTWFIFDEITQPEISNDRQINCDDKPICLVEMAGGITVTSRWAVMKIF